MRKVTIGIGMLCVSLFSFGQDNSCVSNKNVIGNWYVERIELRGNGAETTEEVAQMEALMNESLETLPEPIQYAFAANGTLQLTAPLSDEEFEEGIELEEGEDSEETFEYEVTTLKWILTSNCNELEVRDEEGFDSLMIDSFSPSELVILTDVNEMFEMFFVLKRK